MDSETQIYFCSPRGFIRMPSRRQGKFGFERAMSVKTKAAAVVLIVLSLSSAAAQTPTEITTGFDIAVQQDGAIRVPDVDFRRDWTALGTWSVAGGDEGAAGLHVVYTQPEAVAAYRDSGVFPDGTILIKELFGAETAQMTTGTISRAAAVEGWFVMVKDAAGRYAENPLWGDGWGWALFDADNTTDTVTTDYETDCMACHIPAQQTDWVFVEGYPALR